MQLYSRSSWQIMCAATFALIIRDIQKRFIKSVNTQRSLSFMWIILEPLLHIGLWMLMRVFLKSSLNIPNGFSPALFVLLGAIPFFLFRNLTTESKGSIKANKTYYLFRQIKPIAPIVARVISELMVQLMLGLLILLGFIWFGVDWHLYNLMFLLTVLITYTFWLLGVSLIIAISCFFFQFMNFVVSLFIRFAYLFSGIFYSADMLPTQFRNILLLNPVFQCIELFRTCFRAPYSYIPYASEVYLLKVSLITLTLGLGLYLTLRKKIMMEIEQR